MAFVLNTNNREVCKFLGNYDTAQFLWTMYILHSKHNDLYISETYLLPTYFFNFFPEHNDSNTIKNWLNNCSRQNKN